METRDVDLSQFVFSEKDPRFTALDLPSSPKEVLRMSALVVVAKSMRRRIWKHAGVEQHAGGLDVFRDVFVPSEIVRSPGMNAFEPSFEELVAEEPYPFLE